MANEILDTLIYSELQTMFYPNPDAIRNLSGTVLFEDRIGSSFGPLVQVEHPAREGMNEGLIYLNGVSKCTWEPGRDLPERIDYAPPQLIPSRDTPISTPLWPGPSYVEDKRESTPQHEERSYVSQEPIGAGGTSVNYACDFDAIGNRKDRQEGKNERLYEANNLNHYEEIVGEYASFAPRP